MSVIPIIGTAYTLPKASHNAELTEVGRGTPSGELLRRYWQPICLSADASDLPREESWPR